MTEVTKLADEFASRGADVVPGLGAAGALPARAAEALEPGHDGGGPQPMLHRMVRELDQHDLPRRKPEPSDLHAARVAVAERPQAVVDALVGLPTETGGSPHDAPMAPEALREALEDKQR